MGSISYSTFIADLLPQWAADEPVVADARCGSAKQAAMHALHAAATEQGKGTVLVVTATSADRNAVQGFIEAMCESQPMLAGLQRRILVEVEARVPLVKDVVHTIRLSTDEDERVVDLSEVDVARSIAFSVSLHMRGRIGREHVLPLLLGDGSWLVRLIQHEELVRADRMVRKHMSVASAGPGNVAGLPNAFVPREEEQRPTRDAVVVSAEFEKRRADTIGLKDLAAHERPVLRTRRARWTRS